MSVAARAHGLPAELVSVAPKDSAARAAFEACFAVWMPRIYAFASARLAERGHAEAATRATLEAAVRLGLFTGGERSATALLRIAKAEIERQRRSV